MDTDPSLFGPIELILSFLKDYATVILPVATLIGGFALGDLANRRKERFVSKQESDKKLRALMYPLLISAVELEDRLRKIILVLDQNWLQQEHLIHIKNSKGFAEDTKKTGYFVISSLYLLSRYFCYVEIISREIGLAYHPISKIAKNLNVAISRISKVLQYKELFDNTDAFSSLKDAGSNIVDSWRLHRQFQHSIGESLIVSDGNKLRCMSFKEFFKSFRDDAEFRYWMSPLEEYFVGMANLEGDNLEDIVIRSGDIRVYRIIALHYWLEQLIEILSQQFSFQIEIERGSLLRELPSEVRACIINLKLDTNDVYFGQR